MGPAIQKSTVALAYISSQLRFRTPVKWCSHAGGGGLRIRRMDRESEARGRKARIGFEPPRSIPVHDLSSEDPIWLCL